MAEKLYLDNRILVNGRLPNVHNLAAFFDLREYILDSIEEIETNTTLELVGDTLSYTNENDNNPAIDLSKYLDNVNLVSTTLEPGNILTSTLTDATVITTDLSSLEPNIYTAGNGLNEDIPGTFAWGNTLINNILIDGDANQFKIDFLNLSGFNLTSEIITETSTTSSTYTSPITTINSPTEFYLKTPIHATRPAGSLLQLINNSGRAEYSTYAFPTGPGADNQILVYDLATNTLVFEDQPIIPAASVYLPGSGITESPAGTFNWNDDITENVEITGGGTYNIQFNDITFFGVLSTAGITLDAITNINLIGDNQINLNSPQIDLVQPLTPNNLETQFLVRNQLTGTIEYRDLTTIEGSVDYITDIIWDSFNEELVVSSTGSAFSGNISIPLGGGSEWHRWTQPAASHGYNTPIASWGFNPVYIDGGTYIDAEANDTISSSMFYILDNSNPNELEIQVSGYLTGAHGLGAAGTTYFLQDGGGIGTDPGTANQPVCTVIDANTLLLHDDRALQGESGSVTYTADSGVELSPSATNFRLGGNLLRDTTLNGSNTHNFSLLNMGDITLTASSDFFINVDGSFEIDINGDTGSAGEFLGSNGSGGVAWLTPPTGSGGEANTSSNVGVGAGLALPKSGVNLPFKSIRAGTNIVIDDTSGVDIVIYATGAGFGNTLDQAYDEGGAGVGKEIIADTGAVKISGDDGLTVIGTFGSGDTINSSIPVSTAGAKMFFNPLKGAFRAGVISTGSPVAYWDNVNIGDYSVAMGLNNRAISRNSAVLSGEGNLITNTLGGTNPGYHSVISGGFQNEISKRNSVISGGSSNKVHGESSVISGGIDNEAVGTKNTIGGGSANKIYVTSTNSIGATISGGVENEMTLGGLVAYSTISGGQQNIITGSATYASIIGGSSNIVNSTGLYSSILGGDQNETIGKYSISAGLNSIASSYGEISLGVYPTIHSGSPNAYVSSDRVFIIGKGSDISGTTRSDAFTILKNGNTAIDIDNFEASDDGNKLQINGSITAVLPVKASHAAADSDVNIPTGGFYRLSVGTTDQQRTVFQKP